MIVHVAGLHGPARAGCCTTWAATVLELYRQTGDTSFSAIIRCELDGLTVTGSQLDAGPFPWRLGVKVQTAHSQGGPPQRRPSVRTHNAVILLDGATAFEPVDVDPATYAGHPRHG